jgi:hypothetical protein
LCCRGGADDGADEDDTSAESDTSILAGSCDFPSLKMTLSYDVLQLSSSGWRRFARGFFWSSSVLNGGISN